MTVTIDAIAKLEEGHWIAWWYGGLLINNKAPSQMLVAVNFRRIRGTVPEGKTVPLFIGVTQIGQVPLGSIWLHGERVRNFKFTKRTFKVNFTAEAEQFLSLNGCADENLRNAFREKWPPLIYRKEIKQAGNEMAPNEAVEIRHLPTTNERSYLIKLATANDHHLMIPCMEFFSRLYGRSAEVKRALVGYPWDESEHGAISRLYANVEEPTSSNFWKVKLKGKTVNEDVVFLAHAKYDPFTIAAVRSIHAQIVTREIVPGQNAMHFPSIGPWFDGEASLMVRGIELNDRLFLGLRILGASNPDGALIERDRVDRDKFSQDNFDEERDGFESDIARQIRARIKPPIINITADEEPDHGSAIAGVVDDPFIILGTPRPVVDRPARIVQRQGRAVNVPGDGNETQFSGGAEAGVRKGVGYAQIQAPEVVESPGAQLGMWNALIDLHRLYSERVAPIEWFTFEDGFCTASPPKQILFTPYPDAKSRNRKGQTWSSINWVYINQSKMTMRGLMIMRITVDGERIYFVEPSRKQIEVANGGSSKEERFSGLIFKLDNEDEIDDVVSSVMIALPQVEGVIKNLLNNVLFPGEARSYIHSDFRRNKKLNDAVDLDTAENTVRADLYVRAAISALKKLKIEIGPIAN